MSASTSTKREMRSTCAAEGASASQKASSAGSMCLSTQSTQASSCNELRGLRRRPSAREEACSGQAGAPKMPDSENGERMYGWMRSRFSSSGDDGDWSCSLAFALVSYKP